MSEFLEFVRTIWPIAVVLIPIVLGFGFLWLKTQFPTKADLAAAEARIRADIDAHEARLDEGSRKMADFDKRIALVEDDCGTPPSKGELNQNHAVLAGRMSAVESSLRGLERTWETSAAGVQREMRTLNDYLHTLIEKGLGK